MSWIDRIHEYQALESLLSKGFNFATNFFQFSILYQLQRICMITRLNFLCLFVFCLIGFTKTLSNKLPVNRHKLEYKPSKHNAHLSNTYGNNLHLQFPFGLIGLVAEFSQQLGVAFTTSCSKNGYKRGNYINIENKLNQRMRFRGTYQDTGKIYKHGQPFISKDQRTGWQFVKKTISLSGTSGIIVYQIEDKTNNSLIIFYENPWNSWNYFGVCIDKFNFNGQQPIDQQTLKNYFLQLQNSRPNWKDNCLLLDNTETQRIPFYENISNTINGYSIGMIGKYQYFDGRAANNCYNQQVNVVIMK